MSKDLNRWTGIGRLGKDVELRYFPSGDAVANVSIACGDDYKDREGNKIEKTEWVNLVIPGKLAEVASKYLHKGSRIYVEGKLTTRKWQDKEGKDRFSTEIRVETFQMLDGKPADGQSRSAAPRDSVPSHTGRPQAPAADVPFEDDDIPF